MFYFVNVINNAANCIGNVIYNIYGIFENKQTIVALNCDIE
jgi:hypothetical protein